MFKKHKCEYHSDGGACKTCGKTVCEQLGKSKMDSTIAEKFADFVTELLEAGRIQTSTKNQDDVPILWGMIKTIKAQAEEEKICEKPFCVNCIHCKLAEPSQTSCSCAEFSRSSSSEKVYECHRLLKDVSICLITGQRQIHNYEILSCSKERELVTGFSEYTCGPTGRFYNEKE